MSKKRVVIIAEAGVNHNGNINLAKKLIDIAADAGADYVKFQTFKASMLATQQSPKANYQNETTGKKQTQFQILKNLELTDEMHIKIIKHCKKRKISFFSTAFDIQSLNYLKKLGLNFFKIPSGEINNFPYLQRVACFRKPVILSTGMATMDEIKQALNILEKKGISRKNITILHCNTEYPTPLDNVNLKAMCNIRKKFGAAVGYSDHTLGTDVAIAAVALGASVIEKHFTLDRKLPGPDHKASLLPAELKRMIRSIRNIEKALGDGIKQPSPSELKNIPIVRKSIVATKKIKAGELFTEKNIGTKRPGTGISPMLWKKVIGQTASKNFEIDELIKL